MTRMAGTIYGSTETTFYVVAVYFGAVAVRRTRHAVAAGLIRRCHGRCRVDHCLPLDVRARINPVIHGYLRRFGDDIVSSWFCPSGPAYSKTGQVRMICQTARRRLSRTMPSFALFLFRFLQRPFQVASIMPSSPMMIRRVGEKMDLSRPVVVAEYGPGEGCHTRAMLKLARTRSRSFCCLNSTRSFAETWSASFADDARVTVIQGGLR